MPSKSRPGWQPAFSCDGALGEKTPGEELCRGLGGREVFSSPVGSSEEAGTSIQRLPPSTVLARSSGEIRGILCASKAAERLWIGKDVVCVWRLPDSLLVVIISVKAFQPGFCSLFASLAFVFCSQTLLLSSAQDKRSNFIELNCSISGFQGIILLSKNRYKTAGLSVPFEKCICWAICRTLSTGFSPVQNCYFFKWRWENVGFDGAKYAALPCC